MKPDDFYAAIVPEPWTILGLKLKPLSLGHLILLHRVGSAFVKGGPVDYNDLAISVFICANTYEDALAAFDDKDLPRLMLRWHDRLTGSNRLLVRLGISKAKPIDLEAKAKAFSEYMQAHTIGPKYIYEPSQFAEVQCPSEQALKAAVQKAFGLSDSEVLNRSYAMCLWDYVTIRALDGQLSMVSSESLQRAEDVGERLAELVRQGRLKGRAHANS